MTDELDAQGLPIPPDEADDTIIEVWEIEPTTGLSMNDHDADTVVERDYHKAQEMAETVINAVMDECEQGQKRTVTVRLTKMRRSHYYEITAKEAP